MNLLALKTEALNHGFDPIVFGSRMVQYINDAQAFVTSRVDYYVDETTNDFSTVNGTTSYPLPADFAKVRSLRDTTRTGEFTAVGLRTIDRSTTRTGPPTAYAMDGANLHLYPTPDAIYPLELRYWRLPPDLVGDTDVPTIPARYHRMLWEFAVAQAYWAEDDQAMGQAWDQKFNATLSAFSADVKFPNDDQATQVADMWEGPPRLGGGWTRAGATFE